MSQVSDGEPSSDESARAVPEGAADDFAWLYRRDGYASSVRGDDPRTLVLPLDSQLSSPSSYQTVPQAPPPPRSRNPMIIMIVILLCLTAGAVGGIALLLGSDSATTVSPSAESSMEKAASSAASPSGQLAPLTPTQVMVGCQAPRSTDGAGHPVDYAPEQLFDGKMHTAWRCNGDGVGQVITFELPAGASIVEVGLVNGYSKVDPASGVQRYGEYRRTTQVTWTFANGSSFQQPLNDGIHTMQKLSIPPQPGGQITLTIDASTGPGSTARGRDAVVISEVVFAGSA